MSLPLALFLLPALAAADPPAKIVNGDRTTEFDAVVALGFSSDGELWGPSCTATKVAELWLVTAAHCIDPMLNEYADYTPVAILDDNLTDLSLEAAVFVEEIHPHPDYDGDSLTHDIGLLKLASPGLPTAEVMGVRRGRIKEGWLDVQLRHLGFGSTATEGGYYGIKHYADIPIHGWDRYMIYGADPEDGQNICYGDSGGPALWRRLDGDYELVGVNSMVLADIDEEQPCENGMLGATRVDIHRDWIESYVDIKTADELQREQSAGCASGGRRAGRSWALSGLALCLLLGRAGRRRR